MTWRCIDEPAQRSSADEFVAIADRADRANTDADAAAIRFGHLGSRGWSGFSGPHADAVGLLVTAVGTDIGNTVTTLRRCATGHRTAARQLRRLQEQSDRLAARARQLDADLDAATFQLGRWREIRADRWRLLQLRRLDPTFGTTAIEHDYQESVRQVTGLERVHGDIVGALDDAQREWDAIRTGEDRIHRNLAADLDAISIPPIRATADGRALIAGLGGLVSGTRRLLGAETADSLLRYVLGPTAMAALDDIRSEISDGDDLGMSNGELNAVRDRLADLDETQRAALLGALTDVELERVFHNVHSSGFWSNDWNDGERTEFYEILAPLPVDLKRHLGRFSPYLDALAEAEDGVDGDDAATNALTDLRTGDGFVRLNFDERTAVLWQAGFSPTESSIDNLDRLSERDWFRDFDLDDTQRSSKMIAFLSSYGSGDRDVIDNTLDRFLAHGAEMRFDWDIDPAETKYGSAGSDVFHFNPRYLDAGNTSVSGSVPTGIDVSDTMHMVTHTVAHEVNHILNEDHVASSFEYFMGEYRGFYVGFMAENGHGPTRADVEDRVEHLLAAGSGAYGKISDAVDDPTEGALIADFVDEMLGQEVAPGDLVTGITNGVVDGDLPAPAPISVDGGPNNLDNT